MKSLNSIEQLLQEAVRDNVFPSAQAEVWLQGKCVFSACVGDAQPSTQFDLASVTKVMSTTSLFLSLWAEKKVTPDTPFTWVGDPKANTTWSDLLFHRSGLPAFRPTFAEVYEKFPNLRTHECTEKERLAARAFAVEKNRTISLEYLPRTQAVYSDVGFIWLGEALSERANQPLDELFHSRIAQPLEITAHFRRLSRAQPEPLAKTGEFRPRLPAPGQEGMWPIESVASTDSGVDDDNAFALDGVAGHAGLFGTAQDVARFGQEVLWGLQGKSTLAPKELWEACCQIDITTPGSTRAMGFDTTSPEGSSAGQFIGKKAPGAVGHLGFTGNSLWVDVARQLVVSLVSNRTFFGRHNQLIKIFRPRFHDEVVRALSLES